MTKNHATKGFTLIELLTVIAIISLLAAIIISSLTTARQRSRDAKRVSDLNTIRLGLSLYFNDNSHYPGNMYDASTGLAPSYITTLPTDPNYSVTPATCAATPTTAGCYSYAGLNAGGSGGSGSARSRNPGATIRSARMGEK